MCAFFDSHEEHYNAVIPYFAEGLLLGEQILNVYERDDHAAHPGAFCERRGRHEQEEEKARPMHGWRF